MKNILTFTIAMLLVFMSGCADKAPELAAGNVSMPEVIADNQQLSNDSQLSNMEQMNQSVQYASEDERIAAVQREVEPVYFATDSYTISATEHEKIDNDALIFNGELARDLSIKIEGSCDEWGTDEYNCALGLKRAKSAKDALSIAGVDEGRMALISYGESKPICAEHNEACWQQNRRADFTLLP